MGRAGIKDLVKEVISLKLEVSDWTFREDFNDEGLQKVGISVKRK